jgi:hypothetical protein
MMPMSPPSRRPYVALLCVLAGLLVPGSASANTAAEPETRVGASDLADQVRVGVECSLTLYLHRGCAPRYDELASASLLAARGGANLSKQAQKSIRSFEKNIAEHRAKLDAYKRNPDAFDNKGFLKNAPSQEIRERIIEGRIQHLEGEIRGFQNQIDRLIQGGGDAGHR